jgi:ABC-2 type transport system permease protein
MATLLVYYVVFQIILKSGIPYFAIYLICGVLAWNLFSTAMLGATGSIVGNSGLVKKVAFPREILPLASVGAATVHFFLQGIVLLGFLVAFRYPPALSYLPLLIPALLALLLITAALGVFLAAVNVYLRDMQHLMEIALTVWFWATPIVYPYMTVATMFTTHGIPTWVYRLNPVTPIVLAFQRAIYRETTPKGTAILPPTASFSWYLLQLLAVTAVSIVLFVLALTVFARLEGNFAEEL